MPADFGFGNQDNKKDTSSSMNLFGPEINISEKDVDDCDDNDDDLDLLGDDFVDLNTDDMFTRTQKILSNAAPMTIEEMVDGEEEEEKKGQQMTTTPS